MTTGTTTRDTISAHEIAERNALPLTTIYDAIRRGQIPALRIGRRIVVPMQAYEAWLASAGAIE